MTEQALARAIEGSERLRVFDLVAVDDLLSRAGGHRGRRRLRGAIGAYREPPPLTRVEAERALYEICLAAGLPRPACNANIVGHEVDLVWRDRNVAVELDGFDFHGTQAQRERDHARDAEIYRLARVYVHRVTARSIVSSPDAVIRGIADLLRE